VIRAFIAIELSETTQASISRFQQQLQSRFDQAPVRWVPVGNMHLTLKFLGDVHDEQIGLVQQALESSGGDFSPISFTIKGFSCFPSSKRPRVLWLGVEPMDDQLLGLQGTIEEALLSLGFEREQRRYHPHLTLGRIKRSASPDHMRALALGMQELEDMQKPVIGDDLAEHISLIQSQLTPSGPQYSTLAKVMLRSRT
jgi:2'-5' RNA ligase